MLVIGGVRSTAAFRDGRGIAACLSILRVRGTMAARELVAT